MTEPFDLARLREMAERAREAIANWPEWKRRASRAAYTRPEPRRP